MKRDFFFGVILVILLGAALAPIPKNLSLTEGKRTITNDVKSASDKQANDIDCSFTQNESDELASLTDQNQNSKVSSCLFLGCNGFF